MSLAASLTSVGLADQGTGGGYRYTYHKQSKALALDTTRIVLQAASQQVAEKAVAAAGIGGARVEATALKDWWMVTAPGGADASRIERLVATLAADPTIDFAAPVFFDDFGGPMWPTRDLMVGFVAGQSAAEHDRLMAVALQSKLRDRNYLQDVDRVTADSKDGFVVLEASNKLASMNQTLFAEPDMVFTGHHHAIPNDPQFGDLWGLHNTGQAGGLVGSDMRIAEAWDVTAGSSAIIDVVIDNGVDLTHPDLNLAPGNDLTGNGTNGGPGNNCDSHGTAVAGCISARINNSLGVVGAAPGCRVAPARCFVSNLSCDGSWTSNASWTVNALTWAQSIGARVTNNSNGYGFTSATIDTAYANTRAAGIIHFASSGNDSATSLGYPARLPSIDAVGAMDRFGNRASFSNTGTNLAFSAPGVAINSTDRQGALGFSSNDYNVVSGTSFASPYASAVACLILSRNSSLTVAQVESTMQFSARDLGVAGYDTDFGYGYVNAQGALNLLVPPGDGCSSAAEVSGFGGVFNSTLVGATNPTFVGGVCGNAGGNPDVWYHFVAPMAGTLNVGTCGTNDIGGVDAGIDTVVSLHADCFSSAMSCSDDGACNGVDAGTARDSFLARPMSAGESILIRVSKFSTGAVGPFILTVAFVGVNDNCNTAFDVSGGGVFAGSLVGYNNEIAYPTMCGAAQTNPDAWYTFTAPTVQGYPIRLIASTCGTHDANGAATNSGMDTVLSFHQNSCGAAPSDCNDDANGGGCGASDVSPVRDSYLTRVLGPGETILIRVSKFGTVAPGPFRLNISTSIANDACADALPISAGVMTPFDSTTATTDGPTENVCLNAGDNNVWKDVWYLYTTRGAGRFTVRTCGSSFDTKVAIYNNSCPTPSTPNLALACNDDAGAICSNSGLNSNVTVVGAANTPYLIRVGGYSNASGPGIVTVYCAGDFNLSGAVTVQDIFDFLAAYFAGNPAADINGSGTTTVQDIFDFLAAYFAGCN